ncbi:MAG: methylmalonyl-CoA epimerase [Planctomycetota bacterium]
MSRLRLDHIGIAVRDLDEALRLWRDALGAHVEEVERVEGDGVRVAFLDTGGGKTELLEPTRDDSPVARFLDRGGNGIHHVAYRVKHLDRVLEQLKEAGVALIDESPRPGSRDTRVAFLHPRGTGGS